VGAGAHVRLWVERWGATNCVFGWRAAGRSGADPRFGTTPTLLKFGWKCWVGVAPTLFFVWLEDSERERMAILTPLVGPTCHRVRV
jgi:hypothetical protein